MPREMFLRDWLEPELKPRQAQGILSLPDRTSSRQASRRAVCNFPQARAPPQAQ